MTYSLPQILALATRKLGEARPADVVQLLQPVVAAQPQVAEAWHLLGVATFQLGRREEALAMLRAVLEREPRHVQIAYNVGVMLQEMGRWPEAIQIYQHVLQLVPDHSDAWNNLGNVWQLSRGYEQALEAYQRAVQHRPNFADAWSNMAASYQQLGQMEQSFACLKKAVALQPQHADALNNLAVASRETGDFAAALQYHRQALALRPEHPSYQFNFSHFLLLTGDFAGGWEAFEWRWRDPSYVEPYPRYHLPRWNGEALTGKSLLIVCEQGFGDTFQFVRYAKVLRRQVQRLVAHAPRQLIPLLSLCPEFDAVLPYEQSPPICDFYVPLLSVPWIVKTTLPTIPAQLPYLVADPRLVEAWREKLAPFTGLRVGINWQGRPIRGTWQQRDIPRACFESLTSLPGITFFSLQKRIAGHEPQPPLPGVVEVGPDFDDSRGPFMDTAAIMKNLDLIISSDTSVPHLAGALGVPVWLALLKTADWRWLLDREDSPWYPVFRLFRQRVAGDWQEVFERMKNTLATLRRPA